VFSPGVNVDQTWEAVKQYQEDVMKVRESDKEKLYYDHYNTEDLEKIIETQSKVILHMKKQKHSHLFSVLVIVDLRNAKDLETFLEELSALILGKELIEIYHLATREPYSFLYINLVAPRLKDTFFIIFTQKI
jgi:hypothetical protein